MQPVAPGFVLAHHRGALASNPDAYLPVGFRNIPLQQGRRLFENRDAVQLVAGARIPARNAARRAKVGDAVLAVVGQQVVLQSRLCLFLQFDAVQSILFEPRIAHAAGGAARHQETVPAFPVGQAFAREAAA